MKPKVLIVEDDDHAREAIKVYFSKRDFDIRQASHASTAISLGKTFRPQILIADWMLSSDGDGVEVAKELKKANPELKVIFVTGYRTQALLIESEKIGGKVLEKPLTLKELYLIVRHELAKS